MPELKGEELRQLRKTLSELAADLDRTLSRLNKDARREYREPSNRWSTRGARSRPARVSCGSAESALSVRPWVDRDRAFWVRKREASRRLAAALPRVHGCRALRPPRPDLQGRRRKRLPHGGDREPLRRRRLSQRVLGLLVGEVRRHLALHASAALLRRRHQPAPNHKLTKAQRRSYLGYSVLRPVPHGRVGRTVIRPPEPLRKDTLTQIIDEVSFFGTRLTVEGVPFCEQDSEFLRCAHAASWICHYTAAKRGQVGRRTTAEIVELSPDALSPERPLPSQGLNHNQLQVVFQDLKQPAILYGMSGLPQVIGVPNPVSPDEPGAGNPVLVCDNCVTPAGWWDRRMISIICRYLNSGFPVLIGTEDHAFVLVGWRRDDEGQVQFIACDDRIGPYEIISSPFEHYLTPWETIMIPLPPRVYLSGESAEGRAHEHFRTFAKLAPQIAEMEERLTNGEIELRTMLRTGASFKEDITTLIKSEQIVRMVREARLPHWVWIVEAHDRELCRKGRAACVLGMAVFDSTSFDSPPQLDALMLRGSVFVYPPDEATKLEGTVEDKPWRSLLNVH